MEKRSRWKRFGLPAVLVLALSLALAHDLTAWSPHSEAGLLSGFASLAVCIYAAVTAWRCHRAADRRGLTAAVCLLAIAGVVLWISNTIPFCPECDGGVDSPLMRWILANRL